MYKEILQSIEGIEIFPIISLFLFLSAFALVIIMVARMDKKSVAEYSRLPLEDGSTKREPFSDGGH
ncbi:MAG: cbb3-type cytochrome c oxidase subunit 3 [Candidatus Zixiibacteriota bacterium]